ncbi:hypothetical protein M9Y10_006583 [Tritrichomonas musculus]|uniref:Uncharacterized protein n=1 Tax=Tritrichomonas musculus TaxID=1915356 RepID=A0ABR2JEK1_9EUKA
MEVGKLQLNNTTVVAICTDNFSSNKKAINGKKGSAQDLLDETLLRQPCLAHTANLGIEDMFKDDDEFGFVYNAINILMKDLPEDSYCKGYKPSFQSIRWKSMYKCVTFIIKNMSLYHNSYKGDVIKSIDKIERKIGWKSLHQMLRIMWEFISNVERDLATLAYIFRRCWKHFME